MTGPGDILDIIEPFVGRVSQDEDGLVIPCVVCNARSRTFRLNPGWVAGYCETHTPTIGPLFVRQEVSCLLILKAGRQIRRHDIGSASGLMWSYPDGTFSPEQDRAWTQVTGKPANRDGGRLA